MYGVILDRISDAVVVFDNDYHITYLNRAAEVQYGVAAAEVLGRPLQEVHTWRWLQGQDGPRMLAAATAQGSWRGEMIHVTRDGREIAVESSISALRDEQGNWAGFVAIHRELSERKRTEQALQESTARFLAVLEQSLDVVYRRDLVRDRYDYMSPAAERVLGFSAEEMNRMSIADAMARIHPEDRAAVHAGLAQTLARGSAHLEYRWQHKDGQWRWIADQLTVTRDAQGRPLCYSGVARDITEQKQAATRLRANEQKLRLAMAAAELGTWIYRFEGKSWELDARAQRLYGLAAAQPARGEQDLQAVIVEEDRPAMGQAVRRACEAAGDGHYESEHRIRRGDGTIHWISAWGQVEFEGVGAQRRPVRIIGTSRDITASRRAAQALHTSEALLRHALDAGRMVAYDWDATTDAVVRSANADKVLRLPADQRHSGNAFFAMVHPEDYIAVHQALDAARQNHGQYQATFRLLLPDGALIWVEDSGHAEFGADGRVLRLRGVLADVTEAKQAESALRLAHQRLTFHVQNTPLAVIEFDAALRVTMWSAGAQRIFGWEAGEAVGRGMWEIPWLEGEELPQVRQVAAAMLMGQAARTVSPNRNLRKDGRVIWCEWYNSALTDASGKLQSIQSLVLDVSERRRSEEQLRAAKAAAEEASRAKDHFLALLSHELRTPLNPVLMSVSELLHEPALAPGLREDLEMIRRNVGLEVHLIDDLLDITRIARGKLLLQPSPVDLRQILTHAADTCLGEARGKGLDLVLDLGAEPLVVEGDAARLQQVFWNLIKNAVKFTARGAVRVRCRRQEGSVAIVVEDDGIGMKPEVVSRVFDAFEQGGAGTTRRFGGLGLGLAISKALIEMHRGTITARSPGPGQGSCFTIVLPLSAHVVADGPMPATEAPGQAVAEAVRVLVVEDHEDSARTLARLLRRCGHSVKIAPDIATALLAARAERFHVVVSDIGLPDGTGLDLMRQLLLECPGLKGIAVSGHGMESDLQMSRDAGFAAHLVKPVDPKRLRQTIAAVVAQ